MPTTREKAEVFIQAIKDREATMRERLGIDRMDARVIVEVVINDPIVYDSNIRTD